MLPQENYVNSMAADWKGPCLVRVMIAIDSTISVLINSKNMWPFPPTFAVAILYRIAWHVWECDILGSVVSLWNSHCIHRSSAKILWLMMRGQYDVKAPCTCIFRPFEMMYSEIITTGKIPFSSGARSDPVIFLFSSSSRTTESCVFLFMQGQSCRNTRWISKVRHVYSIDVIILKFLEVSLP